MIDIRSMSPLEYLRLEKAAADCGFEMTAVLHGPGLQLRSAHFPETVLVHVAGEETFAVSASDPTILDLTAVGQPLAVVGYGELYAALRAAAAHARTKPNRVADDFKKKTAELPKITEAERLVVERIGQDIFRSALLDYWQGRCCLTGLDIPELLRASHIKPWAACVSDDERLDVFNGLLLAPHVDALFDGGWISFSDDGRVLISEALPADASACLGVTPVWTVVNLKARHKQYLAFHRQHKLRGMRCPS